MADQRRIYNAVASRANRDRKSRLVKQMEMGIGLVLRYIFNPLDTNKALLAANFLACFNNTDWTESLSTNLKGLAQQILHAKTELDEEGAATSPFASDWSGSGFEDFGSFALASPDLPGDLSAKLIAELSHTALPADLADIDLDGLYLPDLYLPDPCLPASIHGDMSADE